MKIEPTVGDVKAVEMADANPEQIRQGKRGEDTEDTRILASPGRRYVGQIIDGAISWAIFLTVMAVTDYLQVGNDVEVLTSIAAAATYFIFSDALPQGKSIGKLVLGMSTINKSTGKSCTLWRAFLRNILSPIIGTIDALFILGKGRQRIGDKLANTIVVLDK